MKVTELLDTEGIKYEATEHKPVFTAQRMAAVEHEGGKFVAKPVVVKLDGKSVMCVLGACYKIDLAALKKSLGAKKAELATEDEIGAIFDDCELGAEPPFGNLYDVPVIMDKALVADDHIVFQAGTHEQAIRMNTDDYRRLVEPKVLDFSYHMT